MTFEAFQATVLNDIRNYLPEEYGGAEILLNETQKLNQTYPALVIKREEHSIAPSIDLTRFYERAEQGQDMSEILSEIAEIAQIEPEGLNPDRFTDYSEAKNMLFIRVSNCEANKEYLKNIPHKEISGLAVTCHVLVSIDDSSTGSLAVTNDLMKQYGVSFDKLYQDAVENSQKLFPPKVLPITAMIMGMSGFEMGMESEVPDSFSRQVQDIDLERDGMAVITNQTSVNGAAVIFYPDVLKTIGDHVEENYYILPSSIHEVIVVADNKETQLSFLEAMVKEVNHGQVAPKDRLSDTVFHYDYKEHLFERAADYESRINDKEKQETNKDSGHGSKAQRQKEREWER